MGNQILVTMEKVFRKKVHNDKNIQHAFFLIHSEKHGIHLNMAEGTTEGGVIHPGQPFFIASIDKIFTAVLIAKFAEEGKLSFDDRIVSYLD